MQILSYRGPSTPGGVSNTLTRLYEQQQSIGAWWYVRDGRLDCNRRRGAVGSFSIAKPILENHYRYCNNFLWPILHDLQHLAHYSEYERQCYRGFNAAIAFRLKTSKRFVDDNYFVNDYQLALIPGLFGRSVDSFVFWHIPWPKNVQSEHVSALAELAASLLQAKVIGFHTTEYMENFFNFVDLHMHRFAVDFDRQVVRRSDRRGIENTGTKFVVAPLGVDSQTWEQLAKKNKSASRIDSLPYLLSVDRCDYTKGIKERLDAIDCFFTRYPQWREKVQFHQIGTRSRDGLTEFDRYWATCRARAQELNGLWSTEQWAPLIWTETPKADYQLAVIYNRAAVMLVSPVRDGLNLTAKEFVSCQTASPGVLALSRGAGVWAELGEGAVELDPEDTQSYADKLALCLTMSETERYRQNYWQKSKLRRNTLSNWWHLFVQTCNESSTTTMEKVYV